MGSQLGSVWMLTLSIIICVSLGRALAFPRTQKNAYRPLYDEVVAQHEYYDNAQAQYEYLQFHGTIINLSDKQFGGTGDLSWGKWMSNKSPRFPINQYTEMTFKSQGRDSSPSGTTGYVKIYLSDDRDAGEFTINFDCPYIGDNKCNHSGDIPGVKLETISFSGPDGKIASCIMKIVKA